MEALRSPYRIPEQHIPDAVLIEDRFSENGRFVSEKEYRDYYYHYSDFRYEWNNRYLEISGEKNYDRPQRESYLSVVSQYLSRYPIGKVVNSEIVIGISEATWFSKNRNPGVLPPNTENSELIRHREIAPN